MKWFIAVAAILSTFATLTAMTMDGVLVPGKLFAGVIAALTPKPRRQFLFDPGILGRYHSVDEVILDFPNDLKKRSVLILNSKSNQSSTPQEPRVFLYSDDAKQIAAFSGGSSIEFITYTDSSKSFALREIEFQGSTPHLSGINPPQCLGCHGQSPRPIFDPALIEVGPTGGIDYSKSPKGRYGILPERSVDANAVFAELIGHLR